MPLIASSDHSESNSLKVRWQFTAPESTREYALVGAFTHVCEYNTYTCFAVTVNDIWSDFIANFLNGKALFMQCAQRGPEWARVSPVILYNPHVHSMLEIWIHPCIWRLKQVGNKTFRMCNSHEDIIGMGAFETSAECAIPPDLAILLFWFWFPHFNSYILNLVLAL